MRTMIRTRTPTRALAAVTASFLLALAAWAPAAAHAGLSAKRYAVRSVCPAPAPGHASCLALRLVPRAAPAPGARARSAPSTAESPGAIPASEHLEPSSGSLSPADLQNAYGLTGTPAPEITQTIGIIDAFDDATIETDLTHFSNQFGLPLCTAEAGCLRKVNQEGSAAPLPPSKGAAERSWAEEIATDVELAHAVCPSCHILLVEANSTSYANLSAAETTAVKLGASEISNSWGGQEPSSDASAFNHPGIVITASAGDNGYRNWLEEPDNQFTSYPASSPHVVAVGGTRLEYQKTSKAWLSETVWNDGGESEGGFKEGYGASGGGCSDVFNAPPWQQNLSNWSSVGCAGKRAVADVAAVGDPYTGVAIYNSTLTLEGNTGWETIGGTSVASPIIASVFALAGGAHGVAYPARTLYENELAAPAALHDVVSGSNGECLRPFNEATATTGCEPVEPEASCSSQAICVAGSGYDGPTGVGTPNGIAAFTPSSEAQANGGEVESEGEAESPGGGEGTKPPLEARKIPVLGLLPGTSPPPSSGGASNSAPSLPTLSALGLTLKAVIALNRNRPRVSQVGFLFTSSAAVRVHATLAKRYYKHGHSHWHPWRASLTLNARSGQNSARLRGHGVLTPGRYRLTLTPASGLARSMVFQIG